MRRTLPAGTLRYVTDHQTAHDSPDDGPTTLRLAVLVLWIEAAALAVLTAVELSLYLTRDAESPGWSVAMVVTLGVSALLTGAFGWWLVNRRRWARSPAIVLQLTAVPLAYFMLTGSGGPVVKLLGVVFGVVGLATAGLLLSPSARAGLSIR